MNQISTNFLFNLVDDPNEKHNLYPTMINSSSNNKDIFKIVQKLLNKLYEYKNTMTIPWDGYSSKKNNINLKLSKNGLAQWYNYGKHGVVDFWDFPINGVQPIKSKRYARKKRGYSSSKASSLKATSIDETIKSKM